MIFSPSREIEEERKALSELEKKAKQSYLKFWTQLLEKYKGKLEKENKLDSIHIGFKEKNLPGSFSINSKDDLNVTILIYHFFNLIKK